MNKADILPDVANAILQDQSHPLDWVGMEQIAVPVTLESPTAGSTTLLAKANIYVSLDDTSAKGIHMSRLYLLLDEACSQTLTAAGLRDVLARFLESHEGLSDQAFVDFRFDFLARRPALKSEFSGWKAYPARVIASRGATYIIAQSTVLCDAHKSLLGARYPHNATMRYVAPMRNAFMRNPPPEMNPHAAE